MLRRQLIMAGKRFSQAGLSLVEMMVGIAVGLIVVAGASLMMTSQVTQNSRLLQETQIQQDLRAAADLMMRDLRRAGFSTNSANTVWAPGMAAPASNIYAPTSPGVLNGNQVLYAYFRSPGSTGDVPLGIESFGFLWNSENGTLFALNGTQFTLNPTTNTFSLPTGSSATWQPLTDPSTVTITNFTVNVVTQPVLLDSYRNSPTPCVMGDADCPCLLVRRIDISITGTAPLDRTVVRTVNVSTRLRNDQVVDSCAVPAS